MIPVLISSASGAAVVWVPVALEYAVRQICLRELRSLVDELEFDPAVKTS